MGLSDVMSVDELFCPLGGNRERISANVKELRRACRAGGDIPTGESVGSLGNETVDGSYSPSQLLLLVLIVMLVLVLVWLMALVVMWVVVVVLVLLLVLV